MDSIEQCSVDDCERDAASRGWCILHYHRWRSNGSVHRAKPPEWKLMSVGYLAGKKPNHPLANKQGRVYQHRFVLYETIGAGSHPCHWCGRDLHWGRSYPPHPDALTADHLDGVKTNNDPTNLVPSCPSCNTSRANRGNPQHWAPTTAACA